MKPGNVSGVAIASSLLSAATASQPYVISPYTIDAGGGTLNGATYSVSGTIGQPDAGVLAGPTYTVSGGFWMHVGPTGCNPADLADVFGVLDLMDINTFVSAFISQDLLADLTGDGVLDLSDITKFVGAFSAGCP